MRTKAVFAVCVLTFVATARSQLLLEVDGGPGYTAVDIKKWAGTDPREPSNWEQFHWLSNVQAFWLMNKKIGLGLSAGYNHFLWYELRDFYTTYYETGAVRLLGMATVRLAGLILDIGYGAYLFGTFTDTGLATSVGYEIRLPGGFGIPLKATSQLVFDSETNLWATALATGLSWRM